MMRGKDSSQLQLLSPVVLSRLSRDISAFISIVGKSYSILVWILFYSFLRCFLMQSLKSADRQPWGFLRNIQTKAGSPKGLYLELRDPKAPSGAGVGWRD